MGGFLMHTLNVTTQQSDALSREMSPLIFICLELIYVSFCGQCVARATLECCCFSNHFSKHGKYHVTM